MSEVETRVREAVADHGPIGFDEYMEITLYGPGGFFERPPIGDDGHFVTAPHVHPFVFAHCVRDALLETWTALGEPDPFHVVELGAGDGTLAQALLEAFAELPMPRVDYVGVEISSGARAALEARGIRAVERLEELDAFRGAVIANELLDNLPFVVARGRPGGPVEVRIGLDAHGALTEVEVPWRLERLRPPRLSDGQDSTVPLHAFGLLDTLADRLLRGSVLLIDYGEPDGPAGTVHGYREHRKVADVLSDPGGTDVTAGVDWRLVADHARTRRFEVLGPVKQKAALRALGLVRWERTMLGIQSMLQGAGKGAEAVRVWQARTAASRLADPTSFGAFWWLILSVGTPAPDWIERASPPHPSGAC
jgi:SAM-dependent MidA family methyltransferase